jgi:hypothetical protein
MSATSWFGDKSKNAGAIIKWFFYQTLLKYDGCKLSFGKRATWQPPVNGKNVIGSGLLQ